MSPILIAVLSVYGLLSLVTFAAYGVDKRAARLGHRRIPEKRLHQLELCGGWPGGLAGQATFRHKRRKGSYMLVFWAIVVLHVLAWGAFGAWSAGYLA